MPGADGTIAVTGAAGYLGGRVATAVGDDCRALVRGAVPWLPASSQVVCDLLGSAEQLAAALRGASTVIHLAGHNEVIAGSDPDRASRETTAMARSVADAALAEGVERVVYVSTVHVYGKHLEPGAVITEDLDPRPTSAYAEARWACEQVLSEAGLDVVALRLTNAVGAPAHPSVDRWTLVASDLCRRAVLDRTLVLKSSGQQWRDFIALEDASRLVVAATDRDAVPAGTYNLASGESHTVRALAELVQERVQKACGWLPELQAPPASGTPDPPYSVATAGLGDLGLRAAIPLEDGVDEIIEHCIEHEEWLRAQEAAR